MPCTFHAFDGRHKFGLDGLPHFLIFTHHFRNLLMNSKDLASSLTTLSSIGVTLLLVGHVAAQVPAKATTITAITSVKATEQFIKLFDPVTSQTQVEIGSPQCPGISRTVGVNGYAQLCKGTQAISISPSLADAVERRDGLIVLSFITANGIARARQQVAGAQWLKAQEFKGIIDAQAECIAGAYMKSALPLKLSSDDLYRIQAYIQRTGTPTRVFIPRVGGSTLDFSIDGTMRASIFRFGYDSGKLDSCFVDNEPSRDTESLASYIKRMLENWTGKDI